MPRLFLLFITLVCAIVAAPARAEPFTSGRIAVEVMEPPRPAVPGPVPSPAPADVILIPGLASTPVVWRRTAEQLARTRRVHLVAVRGFGPLAAGDNARGALNGAVSGEIRRYITEQRLRRPAVIGHSMGGQIALRLAADGRDEVGRVMVVDAAPFFPSLISERASVREVEPLARLSYQAVLLLGDEALKQPGALGEGLVEGLGGGLGAAGDTVFAGLGWQGGDRRVLAQGLYEVLTLDLRGRLREITAPVTVVYGWSPDDRSPRAHVDRLFRLAYRNLPRPARFERIEGAEHMVMIDRPTAFLAAVERFLG